MISHILFLFGDCFTFFRRSPCSGVCLWNELLVTSYSSGHLRLFRVSTGHMCAEVTAHARWITALDVSSNGLVSTLIANKLKMLNSNLKAKYGIRGKNLFCS